MIKVRSKNHKNRTYVSDNVIFDFDKDGIASVEDIHKYVVAHLCRVKHCFFLVDEEAEAAKKAAEARKPTPAPKKVEPKKKEQPKESEEKKEEPKKQSLFEKMMSSNKKDEPKKDDE